MWALVVVKADPVANHTAGVLQRLEPVAVHALVLECADHALDHAVLFRAVRRDELLLQPIAFDQGRITAAGEHQPIVRAQQERLLDLAQTAIAGGVSEFLCARRSGYFP